MQWNVNIPLCSQRKYINILHRYCYIRRLLAGLSPYLHFTWASYSRRVENMNTFPFQTNRKILQPQSWNKVVLNSFVAVCTEVMSLCNKSNRYINIIPIVSAWFLCYVNVSKLKMCTSYTVMTAKYTSNNSVHLSLIHI